MRDSNAISSVNTPSDNVTRSDFEILSYNCLILGVNRNRCTVTHGFVMVLMTAVEACGMIINLFTFILSPTR